MHTPQPFGTGGDRPGGTCAAQLWTYIGSALFLVALLVSAIIVPQLRLLHAFQALIYVAVIVLVRRNSPWGYGAGFAVAIVWNGIGLFVSHLIQTGAIAIWSWLGTGHPDQVVPMMVALGGLGHFILIVAAVFGVMRSKINARRWWKFAGGGILSIAYFMLLVAVTQPR